MGITIDNIYEAGKDTDYKPIDDEHDELQFQLLVPLVDGDPIEPAPEFVPLLDLVPLPAPELPELDYVLVADSDASHGPPQSQSRHYMSDAEKLYLEASSPTTVTGLVCPDKHTIMNMVTDGKASGSLSPGVTVDGARSHLRRMEKHFQKPVEVYKKDKKKDQKDKKKDKKANEKGKKADKDKGTTTMKKDKVGINLD
jgi:hypothetical protein